METLTADVSSAVEAVALSGLAQQIRQWQLAREISDNALVSRFAGLRSTRTYKRILEGEFSELGNDLERHRLEYEQVWTLMELEAQNQEEDEEIYHDLGHVSAAFVAVKDALHERGNNRLVIVEGPSGSGKTTAGRHLAERFGRKVVMAEADETWKESLNAMLGGVLRALGVANVPASSEARKTRLVEALKVSPVCLVIDEAHHLGPRTLNLVKTLLNQTQCQVVFLCIETLFKRLESAAYEEAKQLTRNRLCERVRFAAPTAAEVEKFLARRLTFEGGTIKACAKTLADRAAMNGCWNFVNVVSRQCRKMAGKGAVDAEVFARAITRSLGTR